MTTPIHEARRVKIHGAQFVRFDDDLQVIFAWMPASIDQVLAAIKAKQFAYWKALPDIEPK